MTSVLPEEVRDVLDPLLSDLGRLAEVAAAEFAGRMPVPAAYVHRLREPIEAVLATHGNTVEGCGIVMHPDALADGQRLLEWWWLRPDGEPERLRANLETGAADAYDYVVAPWYRTGIAAEGASLEGPFLDLACSNDYVLTAMQPVRVDGVTAALAAADVPLAAIEAPLLSRLAELAGPRVLVNPWGRVVASTDPRLLPGRRDPRGRGAGRWEIREGGPALPL